jgi:hypothetical protein
VVAEVVAAAAVAEEAEAVAEVAAEEREASARVSRPVRAVEADQADDHGHVLVVTSSCPVFVLLQQTRACNVFLQTYW